MAPALPVSLPEHALAMPFLSATGCGQARLGPCQVAGVPEIRTTTAAGRIMLLESISTFCSPLPPIRGRGGDDETLDCLSCPRPTPASRPNCFASAPGGAGTCPAPEPQLLSSNFQYRGRAFLGFQELGSDCLDDESHGMHKTTGTCEDVRGGARANETSLPASGAVARQERVKEMECVCVCVCAGAGGGLRQGQSWSFLGYCRRPEERC
ncbi:hypothetical protein B0J12DRAFT_47950 [Macrophomina phaseolina]|uniref:Uncharacterized protein n=1 Tax=Macrophomina phaseolina TaxID=35725 RepID=A0ABQ8GE45_9PEZI|nr:hypothetical protein B0J12DRAFT_47950 [Macrophomina phaseolina]